MSNIIISNHNNDIDEWYQSIPTFMNQPSRTLESFSPNEKYTDNLFPHALVTQELINNLIKEIQKLVDENDEDKEDELNECFKILDKARKLEKLNEEWKRISDLYPSYELFPLQLHSDTFKQKDIGDCYFLSMISLISNYGQLLTRLFPIPKNKHGYYEVILFINGWKRVIIDDYIPVLKDKDIPYFPSLLLFNQGKFRPIGAESKEFSKCFYHMLLEKAWAKINKSYLNIEGDIQKNALLTLTGFKGEFKRFSNLKNDYEINVLFETIIKGIRKEGFLFGINTEEHAYSVLDIDIYNINNKNYRVLKIRNPWGKKGAFNLTENMENDIEFKEFIEINKKGKYEFKTKAIVEKELKHLFNDFCLTEDNGIFYMSEKYIFTFFHSYEECFTMFNSTFIEHLFVFNDSNIKYSKGYFYFKIKAQENSLVQLNLTEQGFNLTGRINFNKYTPILKLFEKGNDLIYKFHKNMEDIIEFHYDEPPKEILFWASYIGKIEINFIGIKENINDSVYNRNLKPIKKVYKITEKLGKSYRQQAMIDDFISNILKITIISEQESRGYYIYDKEYKKAAFTFLTNKEKLENIINTQKKYPDNIIRGTSYSYRIDRNGSIYCLNSNNKGYILLGKINFDLFPQYNVSSNYWRKIQ